MLTIERRNDGYSIKVSDPGSGRRGFRVKAKSFEELHLAVTHYYAATTLHSGQNVKCPFCREVEKE